MQTGVVSGGYSPMVPLRICGGTRCSTRATKFWQILETRFIRRQTQRYFPVAVGLSTPLPTLLTAPHMSPRFLFFPQRYARLLPGFSCRQLWFSTLGSQPWKPMVPQEVRRPSARQGFPPGILIICAQTNDSNEEQMQQQKTYYVFSSSPFEHLYIYD